LAALDPTTAQALDWDPGSNNDLGVFDLTLIDRGLLAGQDGDRFNEFLVGRSGFFDFGVPDDLEIPTALVSSPAAGSITDSLTELTGTAGDNRGLTHLVIRLRNVTTQQWLQADGTLGATQVDLPISTTQTGIGEVAWSFPVNSLPTGDYEIRGFSTDAVGNTSTPLAHAFTVPGAAQCTVALDADEQPVITYSGFLDNGVTSIVVRRNGGFLTEINAGSGSFTDTNAVPGDYSYLLRWRPNGVVDVPCTPNSITVPEGGGGITCTVGLDANSDPVLNWTDLGLNSYVVREAGLGFVATESGTSFSDVGRAPGDYSYILRFRQNGTTTDLPCSPSPITVPDDVGPAVNTCSAAVSANGVVTLNWSPIAGEDTYIVRDNDGFVATTSAVLVFDDTSAESGARTYVIRSRQAGVTTNVTCNPDPVIVP